MRADNETTHIPEPLASLGSFNKKRTVWFYDSALSTDSPLEWHLGEIERFIEQHRDDLVAIGSRADVELLIGWSPGSAENPGFSPRLIRLLADLGASVGFDMYVGDEDEHGPEAGHDFDMEHLPEDPV